MRSRGNFSIDQGIYDRFYITTGEYDRETGRPEGYATMKDAKVALSLLTSSRAICEQCGGITDDPRLSYYDPHANCFSLAFCSDECEHDWDRGRKQEREYLEWATRMGYEPY